MGIADKKRSNRLSATPATATDHSAIAEGLNYPPTFTRRDNFRGFLLLQLLKKQYRILQNLEERMSLTTKDAAVVLGMVARGDKKHDIASWFGENPARVQEVIAGDYGNLSAAPADQLLPKGSPGIKARRMKGAVTRAIEAIDSGDASAARAILVKAIEDYQRHEG
ncbi:hypothetical protein [Devosia sp. Naph2]|uniref:hypothetical protein n=1 Tax=Devosia polycyclovorans TaxID=3345148 RepID=UPI0035D0AF65